MTASKVNGCQKEHPAGYRVRCLLPKEAETKTKHSNKYNKLSLEGARFLDG